MERHPPPALTDNTNISAAIFFSFASSTSAHVTCHPIGLSAIWQIRTAATQIPTNMFLCQNIKSADRASTRENYGTKYGFWCDAIWLRLLPPYFILAHLSQIWEFTRIEASISFPTNDLCCWWQLNKQINIKKNIDSDAWSMRRTHSYKNGTIYREIIVIVIGQMPWEKNRRKKKHIIFVRSCVRSFVWVSGDNKSKRCSKQTKKLLLITTIAIAKLCSSISLRSHGNKNNNQWKGWTIK